MIGYLFLLQAYIFMYVDFIMYIHNACAIIDSYIQHYIFLLLSS